MNSPLNISYWFPDKEPHLFGPAFAFTIPGNAYFIWFQTLWHHLSERGTAGLVMVNGAMTTGSQDRGKMREYMICQGMVNCTVQMPDKHFLNNGIPDHLFILNHNRNGREGEHRKREILYNDARKLGHLVTKGMCAFPDANIARITDT